MIREVQEDVYSKYNLPSANDNNEQERQELRGRHPFKHGYQQDNPFKQIEPHAQNTRDWFFENISYVDLFSLFFRVFDLQSRDAIHLLPENYERIARIVIVILVRTFYADDVELMAMLEGDAGEGIEGILLSPS